MLIEARQQGITHNVKALLSGFEFEKQNFMEYTKGELLDLVERYKVDKGIQLGTSETVEMCYFAKWLLSQNLQQCNVSGSLELLAQMLNERKELAKQGFETWQELQMNSDSENALLRVMRLIGERQANAR